MQWDVKTVANVTLGVIAVDGWISKKMAPDFNTAYTVRSVLMTGTDGEKYAAARNDILTAQVVGWIDGLAAKRNRSDFEDKLFQIARQPQITLRDLSIFVAGVSVAKKALEGAERVRQELATKSNEWIGAVGEKLRRDLTVKSSRVMETAFGTSTLIVFEDDAGNSFKWFASGERQIEAGSKYTVQAKIKKHDDYQGRRNTILTRASFVATILA